MPDNHESLTPLELEARRHELEAELREIQRRLSSLELEAMERALRAFAGAAENLSALWDSASPAIGERLEAAYPKQWRDLEDEAAAAGEFCAAFLENRHHGRPLQAPAATTRPAQSPGAGAGAGLGLEAAETCQHCGRPIEEHCAQASCPEDDGLRELAAAGLEPTGAASIDDTDIDWTPADDSPGQIGVWAENGAHPIGTVYPADGGGFVAEVWTAGPGSFAARVPSLEAGIRALYWNWRSATGAGDRGY